MKASNRGADGDGMIEETRSVLVGRTQRRGTAKRGRRTGASELRAEIRRLRREQTIDRSMGAWAAPLAALFLLRWAEHLDALAPRYRWSRWKDLPEKELVQFVRQELVPALAATSAEPLGNNWRHVAMVLQEWVRSWPETIPAILKLCRLPVVPRNFGGGAVDTDFSTARGRLWAGEALATMVDPVGGVGGAAMAESSTPQPVVELMVDLLDPRPGERIYDPCFGGGNLLAEVSKRLRDEPDPASSVFGMEIDPHAYCVGLARVVLAGMDHPQLEVGNALERSWAGPGMTDGFDGIVAVPPWGKRDRRDTWTDLPVASANNETLFLQHVMTSLRPDGRAVIALPDAALSRGGGDTKVRKRLLTDYHVDGVISLPAGAFRPYTGVKTSLLVFRRTKATSAVRFLQVKDWPRADAPYEPSKGRSDEVGRGAAERFVRGTPDASLWETPVEQLAKRDCELIAKRTGSRALARSLEALKTSNQELSLLPLQEVADVFAGTGRRRTSTAKDGGDASGIGLLSAADLGHRGRNVAPTPSRFLTANDAAAVSPERRLRSWDLVVVNTGQVGLTGIVLPNQAAVGAVADRGLTVVRPGDELDALFLLQLLWSPHYERWLRGHARGVAVQRLPIRRLKSLPVPVPAIDFQRHVSKQWRELGSGGNDLLTNMMEWADLMYDPMEMWFHRLADTQRPDPNDTSTTPLELLEGLSRAFRRALSKQEESHVVHGSDSDRADDEWYREIVEPLDWLRDLKSVPAGSGRLAVLDHVRFAIKTATTGFHYDLDGLSHIEWQAYQIEDVLLPLLEAERESILATARLETELERDSIQVSADDGVPVRIKNASLLPLRNVEVSASPAMGSRSMPYLADGEELTLPVTVPDNTPQGLYRFWVEWKADRLDGIRVSGEEEQAVHVTTVRETPRSADFDTSPYIVGSPVDKSMFFGRREIIEGIKRQLPAERPANVVLLEGNRRTGKTSILKRMADPGVLPDWLIAYCSFQGGSGHANRRGLDTTEVFRLLARDVGWAAHDAGLHVWLPGADGSDSNRPFKVAFAKALSDAFSDPQRAFELFELFMRDVLEAARPRRILLVLDEFDKLKEGIDEGITSPQVPENLRFLLHQYGNLSAVLAGSRRLKRLREEYWSALFGLGHRISVGELPEESARQLVTKPVEDRLFYTSDARDRIVDLCARQPFLIQSLCNRIFERAARLGKRTVALADVDEEAEAMARDNEHLHTLWGYAKTERRRFVLALCQRLDEDPDPVTLDLLELKFGEHGVGLPSAVEFSKDLDALRELELLQLRDTERKRGAAYGLATPLMAKWIRHNVDFEGLKRRAVEESDRQR